MPNKCCVPACSSNYKTGKKVQLFSFPKVKVQRKKWLSAIPRKDFFPTENYKPDLSPVVCHFRSSSQDSSAQQATREPAKERKKFDDQEELALVAEALVREEDVMFMDMPTKYNHGETVSVPMPGKSVIVGDSAAKMRLRELRKEDVVFMDMPTEDNHGETASVPMPGKSVNVGDSAAKMRLREHLKLAFQRSGSEEKKLQMLKQKLDGLVVAEVECTEAFANVYLKLAFPRSGSEEKKLQMLKQKLDGSVVAEVECTEAFANVCTIPEGAGSHIIKQVLCAESSSSAPPAQLVDRA
ncbi:hypothetical protein HPB51_020069 [Rhipicephalus microplus]|uniref:THAP-type domain-containing protein n=1 Tax=Rhipicephalus microplus TaxID=6941 RepID=A0A9J6E339_RHIMP|nr:hypothetical protein HPB51_020069 [Rhipicephalus microplus]